MQHQIHFKNCNIFPEKLLCRARWRIEVKHGFIKTSSSWKVSSISIPGCLKISGLPSQAILISSTHTICNGIGKCRLGKVIIAQVSIFLHYLFSVLGDTGRQVNLISGPPALSSYNNFLNNFFLSSFKVINKYLHYTYPMRFFYFLFKLTKFCCNKLASSLYPDIRTVFQLWLSLCLKCLGRDAQSDKVLWIFHFFWKFNSSLVKISFQKICSSLNWGAQSEGKWVKFKGQQYISSFSK